MKVGILKFSERDLLLLWQQFISQQLWRHVGSYFFRLVKITYKVIYRRYEI
jgi:hypothetical protein